MFFMGFNRYSKALKLLENIKKIHGDVVSSEFLKKEIIMHLGGDEKQTVRPYLRMMFELKMIIEEGENVRIADLGEFRKGYF